jgi:hypothetical protein
MTEALRVCKHGSNSKLYDTLKWLAIILEVVRESFPAQRFGSRVCYRVLRLVRISVPNGPIWVGAFAQSHLTAEGTPVFGTF